VRRGPISFGFGEYDTRRCSGKSNWASDVPAVFNENKTTGDSLLTIFPLQATLCSQASKFQPSSSLKSLSRLPPSSSLGRSCILGQRCLGKHIYTTSRASVFAGGDRYYVEEFELVVHGNNLALLGCLCAFYFVYVVR